MSTCVLLCPPVSSRVHPCPPASTCVLLCPPVSCQLSSLEAGCFHVVASSLRFLDLSSNRLSSLDLAALGGVRAQTNLTQNPWHCDCRMQVSFT